MAGSRLTSCCGLGEISSLSRPQNQAFETQLKGALKGQKILKFWKGYSYMNGASTKGQYQLLKGAMFFTSHTNSKRNYAQRFAHGIVERGLGTIRKLPVFTNPNTSHPITVYLWTIDKDALITYCEKNDLMEVITVRS